MHLKPNIDYSDFFQAISMCHADVLLKSPQGDIITLNSELSKFVFAALSANTEFLKDCFIECTCPEDLTYLSPFVID